MHSAVRHRRREFTFSLVEISLCTLQLGIQYYCISFFNIGKSIGNNRPVLTPDHDDQLLTGNIQILDLLTNTFIFLFHNDYFQNDIFLRYNALLR